MKKPKAETLKPVTVRLPQALITALKHRAIDEAATLQLVMVRALTAYLQSKPLREER